jgi:hypothetical protein
MLSYFVRQSKASSEERKVMSEIKVNEGLWKERPDESKKNIETVINKHFKPKHPIHVVADPKTHGEQPRDVYGVIRCTEACATAEAAALDVCNKLPAGTEKTVLKMVILEAYRNCIRACNGEPPE